MDILSEFDTWEFLGGLGIFLFAMFSLENAIRDLAGRSFKRFIKNRTSSRLKSISTGAIVTAILQSSSAVSLMVLAFVGAGIMAMENAIGVILGSNIGTTATAWIVAGIGFKLDIESFALIFIGIGGLIIIFLGKSERYSNISKLLVAFGFLFMGLSFMKGSVEHITTVISLDEIPDYGIGLYIIIGAVLTAIMQSSSATIAIVLTGLNAHLLQFEDAAAIVIGANIGTTATILLGGIRSTQIKKRVAFSHLIFNLFSGVIGLILLWPITFLIQQFIGPIEDNAVMAIAGFHTIFNIIGVIVFFPFIRIFSKWLTKLIPDKEIAITKYIQGLAPSVFEAASSGLKKEIIYLTNQVMLFNENVIQEGTGKSNSNVVTKKYDELKLLQAEIFKFASEAQMSKLNEQEATELNQLLHCARQSLNAAKAIKDVRHDILKFTAEDNHFLIKALNNLSNHLHEAYQEMRQIIENDDHAQAAGDASNLLENLKKEDVKFVQLAMVAAREEEIQNLETSELLLLNRNFNYSIKLLIHTVMELKLTSAELELFEEISTHA